MKELTRIEMNIQEDPVAALTELTSYMREMQDASGEEKALASLLYSMALDKNYIDVASDSLITPAVKYYSRSSDKVHKFYSYYYLGRVYENAAEYDRALDAFLTAEHNMCKDITPENRVRLYCGKERIYEKQFATDKALEEVKKAIVLSELLPNPQFFIRNSLDAVTFYQRQNKQNEARQTLDKLRAWLIERQMDIPASYYDSDLRNELYHESTSSAQMAESYDNYITACSKENITPDPIVSADVYIRTGDIRQAEECFSKAVLDKSCSVYDSIRYYSTAANLYLKAGNPGKYIYYHEENDRLKEGLVISVFNKDIRYMEDRFINKIAKENASRRTMVLSIIMGILVISLIVSFISFARKREEYNIALADIKEEYALYEAAFFSGDENFPEDVKDLLSSHLSAIAPFISKIPNRDISREELKRIQIDNHELMRSIGLLYSLSYPLFVKTLALYGLNAEEIGLCSLYATGFAAKEMTGTIKDGSVYIINMSIRDKLGEVIGSHTLPAWLRKMFSDCRKNNTH